MSKFPSHKLSRLIHSEDGPSDKRGRMVDKNELWHEAEQCLAQLKSGTRWARALFYSKFNTLGFSSLRDVQLNSKSKMDDLKSFQDLLVANPWLRQRRQFASKAVGALTRLEHYKRS